MHLTARDLVRIPHAAVVNGELLEQRPFTGVSTDTRTVAGGDLFVALRGERFDGHTFVGEAIRRGARAAVVEQAFMAHAPAGIPLLVVENSLAALGHLARQYRDRFSLPVLAVAGSNGKTTTKEMIARVLGARYRVLRTERNFNNQVGVPQTLFRLTSQHEVAVIELGTNHPGEMAALCAAVNPTHGLITNIGREHLEFFGSLEGVAQEEGALFDALAARSAAVAFVNVDDPYLRARARGRRPARTVTYGFEPRRPSVRGRMLGADDAACPVLSFVGGRLAHPVEVPLAVPGAHNALNALAAAAVGLAFRVRAGAIAEALRTFAPADKRMQMMTIGGVLVYNDAYNANPDSTLAALRTLAAARVPGKRIAVLGDMRELGSEADAEHARIGREAGALGLDYLLTYGALMRHAHEAARVAFTAHYDQKNMLAEYLAELVAPGDAVLIKGSRGMAMEDVVLFLQERLQTSAMVHD